MGLVKLLLIGLKSGANVSSQLSSAVPLYDVFCKLLYLLEMLTSFLCFHSKLAGEVVLHRTVHQDEKRPEQLIINSSRIEKVRQLSIKSEAT